MIIKPKVRGFICGSAHPEGCRVHVQEQINYIKERKKLVGPKNVLIIGASTGYGLSARIAATYGFDANTIGVMFEKPAVGKLTAKAGWYNTAAFEKIAIEDGYYAKTINGDAFSDEVKEETIDLIKRDLKTIDLVIYSLAAPRRAMEDGHVFNSCIKTTESSFVNKTLDLSNNTIKEVTIPAATEDEIASTIKVMGGEDWFLWMKKLQQAGVLSAGAKTVAFSYIGPKLTYPIYHHGTIGRAKAHLYDTSIKMNEYFKNDGIVSYISVNKAVVTQASSAIPIVPLYLTILYKVMKEKGTHENCIMQMERLFAEKGLCSSPQVDAKGMIRLDDYEMSPEVQKCIEEIWKKIDGNNLYDYVDIAGYLEEFYQMFGFGFTSVDYTKEYDVDILIPSISN